MPELLFELGCEELPASFVRKAYQELAHNIEAGLAEAEVPFTRGAEPIGTPRRLIVHFQDVAERQPDRSKEVRGPALKAAYDADGNPTKALEGFCRGQGVDVTAVRREGEHVWVTKNLPGAPTAQLLAEILPKAVKSLTFDKAMRWGASRMRFARPIRWILASFAGKAVEFDIEGVKSGQESRGHRFYAPETFRATTMGELLDGLRKHCVEPDPKERERIIREQSAQVCPEKPELIDSLVEENVFLTEWPTAVAGEFDPGFMALPEAVLVTAMVKHERFFPVRDSDGKLTNRFVSIRNAGVDDVVRAGNRWVLDARFNDALFFFREDERHDLDWFLQRTEGIVFQEKLGTVRQRADRLAALAAHIAGASAAGDEEKELARLGGLYCKADLSTGLVGELPALQGIVGGEYAERQGLPHAVCCAIGKHYDLAKIPVKDCDGSRTATRVLMADQLDKLAGYLGCGLIPTGTSDPFGLRRAATMLIEAAWSRSDCLPSYRDLLWTAERGYRDQGIELDHHKMLEAAGELFASRYPILLPSARYDLLEAALIPDQPWQALEPRAVKLRLACMEIAGPDVALVQTATRPLNIVAAARKKGIEVRSLEGSDLPLGDLASEEGVLLASVAGDVEEAVSAALDNGDAAGVVAALRDLQEPISRFFDATMVMVDDATVRGARLELLDFVCRILLSSGDFTRVVIEGT
jgi:glycyl-tRNA synthetase beta chain